MQQELEKQETKPSIDKIQTAKNETASQRIAKLPFQDQIKVLELAKQMATSNANPEFLGFSPCCLKNGEILIIKESRTFWPLGRKNNGDIP